MNGYCYRHARHRPAIDRRSRRTGCADGLDGIPFHSPFHSLPPLPPPGYRRRLRGRRRRCSGHRQDRHHDDGAVSTPRIRRRRRAHFAGRSIRVHLAGRSIRVHFAGRSIRVHFAGRSIRVQQRIRVRHSARRRIRVRHHLIMVIDPWKFFKYSSDASRRLCCCLCPMTRTMARMMTTERLNGVLAVTGFAVDVLFCMRCLIAPFKHRSAGRSRPWR